MNLSVPKRLDPKEGVYTPTVLSLVQLLAEVHNHLETEYGLSHYQWYTEDKGRRVRDKVIKGNTYVITSQDNAAEVTATFTLDTDRIVYGKEVEFDERNAVYLSMFCISPKLQGKGLGSALLKEVEQFAIICATIKGWKEVVLRFDARQEYTALMRFYEKAGYKKLGSFKDGENESYALFEKLLANS